MAQRSSSRPRSTATRGSATPTSCSVSRRHSALGDWSYEPYDTKLARETRGGTILQLSVYVDLLEAFSSVRPERFWVVTPGT